MLPHTGLSWLMKVALQIRIRGPEPFARPDICRSYADAQVGFLNPTFGR